MSLSTILWCGGLPAAGHVVKRVRCPRGALSDGAHRRGGLRLAGSRFRSQVNSQREKPALASSKVPPYPNSPKQTGAPRVGVVKSLIFWTRKFKDRVQKNRTLILYNFKLNNLKILLNCNSQLPLTHGRCAAAEFFPCQGEPHGQYVRSRLGCPRPRTLRYAQRENYVEAYSRQVAPVPSNNRAPRTSGEIWTKFTVAIFNQKLEWLNII